MPHRTKFYKKTWFTMLLLPVLVGLVAALVILKLAPNIGESFGNKIYSSSKDIQSYSYAVARSSASVVNIYVSRLNSD